MRKKKPLTPRKHSQQKRSKETVDAILTAATQVLAKLDTDHITTNKIAEVAGVSIGSYYQYFPNKESLLVKLIDLEVANYSKKLETLFESNQDKSLDELIQILLDDLCDQFLKKRTLARVFIQVTSDFKKVKLVLEAREQIAAKLTTLISSRGPGHSDWTALKSFVVINATMGVIYAYIQSGENNYSEAELKHEIGTMVRRFISGH